LAGECPPRGYCYNRRPVRTSTRHPFRESNVMSDQNQDAIKPWGGRFTEATDAFVERFTASVDIDQRLYHHDINGSIAHDTMLCKVGLLSVQEVTDIVGGLEAIREDIAAGRFNWSVQLE